MGWGRWRITSHRTTWPHHNPDNKEFLSQNQIRGLDGYQEFVEAYALAVAAAVWAA
ncbi:MAG: hypothetical protein ACI9CF_000313 [Candidatus Omnitrophota bacterium]|jgi:hypothetical protein